MNLKRFLSIAACVLLTMSMLALAENPNENIPAEYVAKINNRQQLTNLPTIYLRVPDAEGKAINDVLFKTGDSEKDYHRASIQVVDKTGKLEEFTDNGLSIKVRGNETSSIGLSKLPYRLKFDKDVKDSDWNVLETHKHDMLGKGYSKRNWTLLANMKDPSLIHNALAYHIGELVGMPYCPGYQFVDLVINGEYRGNYMISDHVEVGKNRIEVDEDTGWYFESNRDNQVEDPYVLKGGLNISIKNPEPQSNEETEAIKNEVSNYFTKVNTYMGVYASACSNDEFKDPINGWRSMFNESTLVSYYLGANIGANNDGFMTVKMYKDQGKKMKFGPLWDFDTAMGIYSSSHVLAEDAQKGAPLFCNYMVKIRDTDPVFVKKVHDKLQQLMIDGLEQKIMSTIDDLYSELQQSYTLNHYKWTNYSDNYASSIQSLKNFLSAHLTFFNKEIVKVYNSFGGPTIVDYTVGIDDENEPGAITEGPGPSQSVGPEFEKTIDSKITFGTWEYQPISSSLFNSKATSATIQVTGAVFICISKTNSASGSIEQFSWNDANKKGVTIELEGENLELAKKGSLFIGCNDDPSIKMSITNHGDPSDPTPGPTPTDPEPVHAQLTNLPTIYLSAETIADEWLEAAVEVFDKYNVIGQGTEWKKEGLTKKGNIVVSVQYQGSGKEGTKSSYRLKFNDKIELLSAGEYKQWVLSSNDDDPTMINNALANELGKDLGLPFTPGYQFVDLYVNDEYMGTYQLTDRIKAESGRALVEGGDKDADWHVRFNDKTELKENELQQWQYIAGGKEIPYVIPKSPDPDDLSADAIQTLKNEMAAYFQPLFAKDANGHYTAFAEGVDQQQLIQWYIAQEVLCVYKGFSSIEAYRSVTAEDQKLHIGVLWDSEKAFGNTGENHTIEMGDLNTPGSNTGLMTNFAAYGVMKDLFVDLWQQPWFAEGVKTLWDQKQASLLTDLKAKANSISATLYESQAKNAEVWSEKSPTTTEGYKQAVGKLTSYLDTRFTYLDTKFTFLAAVASLDDPTIVDYILELETEGWEKADLNGDGKVTIEDLTLLLKAKGAQSK